MMVINIIGCGRVGKTLASLFVQNNIAVIGSVVNSSKKSVIEALQFIGQGTFCASIDELLPADIIFITTPDRAITTIAQQLSQHEWLKDKIVVHCSGSLSSEALKPVKAQGAFIASIHPMQSFAQPAFLIHHFKGTYCALEGDAEAMKCIRFLFESIEAKIVEIDKKKKSIYHAAGVFASNYLVTLYQQALNCMDEAGLEKDIAKQVIFALMHKTVLQLEQANPSQNSLTGPVQRGDLQTIQNHLDAMTDPNLRNVYSVLGQATVALTTHDKMKKRLLEELFNEYS